jgi:hypothetical protein
VRPGGLVVAGLHGCSQRGPPALEWSSSPGRSPDRGPHQIRTWRFPPSGSSVVTPRRPGTLRYLLKFRGHGAPSQSLGHVSLQKFATTRAAFARPAPRKSALPGVVARMQPSDSPAASAGALVPLAVGLPRDVRFCEPARRAYVNARRVGRVRCGSPAAPPCSWTARGLPGYRAVRTYVPWSATPPRGIPPRPFAVVSPAAFSGIERLGFPGSIAFRG